VSLILASTEPIKVLKATTPAAATCTDTPLAPPAEIAADRANAWMLPSDNAFTATPPAVVSTVESSIADSVLLRSCCSPGPPKRRLPPQPPACATEMAAREEHRPDGRAVLRAHLDVVARVHVAADDRRLVATLDGVERHRACRGNADRHATADGHRDGGGDRQGIDDPRVAQLDRVASMTVTR